MSLKSLNDMKGKWEGKKPNYIKLDIVLGKAVPCTKRKKRSESEGMP